MVSGADCQVRDGAVDEIHQDPILDIGYQAQLDQEADEDPALGSPDSERNPVAVPPLVASDVRYWSDYNRVHYLPRSIHKLPDLADWETAGGDWQGGKDTFLRYDSVSLSRSHRYHIADVVGFSWKDHALMDDPFRLFVEECDTFQVRTLHGVWAAVGVNSACRAFNFAPIMLSLDPLPTLCSLPSVTSSQNSPP